MTSMPVEFVTEQWYVIASTDEVTDTPLGRTVCGEHIVLFRRPDGGIAALADRCPHRGFPLSMGTVDDGRLQCGYHGLTFDGAGTCVWAPNQTHIPSRANVDAYPLHVTGPWIWVWIGDPDGPRDERLPDVPWMDQEGWTVLHGMERLEARYGLLVDNLLDLSHETYLHVGYIGTPEVATTPIDTEVDDAGQIVRVSRHMESVECPPFYRDTAGLATPIDRWQDIEYRPVCCYVLHVRVAPAEHAPDDDGSDPGAAHLKVLYGITPSEYGSTLDFWALCRDFAHGDERVDTEMTEMQRTVVLQDVEALNAIEARLRSEARSTEVSLKIDTGALAARRMIEQQSAQQPSPAQR